MRYFIYFLLFVCQSCNKENNPGLQLNQKDNELSGKLKDVVKGFGFYVAFYHHMPGEGDMYKVFGTKKEADKDSWYKIDCTDSELKRIGNEPLLIDYTIKMPILKQEADTFVKNLGKFDAFKFKGDKVLTENCAIVTDQKCDCCETIDIPFISIRIYSDSLTTNLKYLEPLKTHENCSNKVAWKNILSIDSLFQNDWIKFRNPKIRL